VRSNGHNEPDSSPRSFLDILFGRPLASSQERAESIGPAAGIPIFGLDALSSAAYGPEAALTLLIPLGAAGIRYIVPISTCIIVLLSIVYFSYRQTIEAYPGGGGSYTVAHENLGQRAGLLAAAALMIDYILVVAVGISAGVGALVSALPRLQRHTLVLCLLILLVITLINLRGVREAGIVFMVPTYLFVGSLLIALTVGLAKALLSGGHPAPVAALPSVHAATAAASVWLLLQAFSSGCTAMTGVEAVSNGVKAFREPAVENAHRTLTAIIALLIVLLAGIAYLVKIYGIGATDPGAPGYESVLSQLVAAVAGKGAFYYVSIASILLVLALSANTAFADFPRLCRAVAEDRYLPHSFATRGRRLVYSQGIYVLAGLSALLLIVFGGVTDRLIPLFAVGAFLAFTLSQAGMVVHWKRTGGPGARHSMIVNGLGACATAVTVVVVLVAKFVEGAWVTALLIPGMIVLMSAVRRHYREVARETDCTQGLDLRALRPPIVVVPILRWDRVAQKALHFALTLSPDVRAVHVKSGEITDPSREDLRRKWREYVETPVRQAGLPTPQLVIVPSPYRFVLNPILNYVLELEAKNPERKVAVLIPELVERRWYHYFLHGQRAALLKTLLFVKGSQQTVVVSVPWYLNC
jgi:amino acid transporter